MRHLRVLFAIVAGALAVSPLAAYHPVRAKHAMVVAQEPLAVDIGVETLRGGGNAVDAAVAVAFALAVTHPAAGNIGGGGFLLARFADGSATFLDFRERAPKKVHRDVYLDKSGNLTRDSVEGWRAAGVPGTVRGLELAHRKYGQRPWRTLVAPAVRLAAEGFSASWSLSRSLQGSSRLAKFEESRKVFLEGGEVLKQPDLARTLERIAAEGSSDFYEGETARRLVAEMEANGGLITAEDLRDYKAVERRPLAGEYQGLGIVTAPPPSSGGIGLLQMFGMLEHSGYQEPGHGAADTIHYLAEVMRRFYADRSEHLADPDYHRVPIDKLLSKDYIEHRRSSINRERASSSDVVHPGAASLPESSETTHISIVDAEGNAVALTYTLNGGYGSGVTVPGLGFLLNNEMDDFAAKPGHANMFGLVQGEANRIEPGKRPLSSMTPTIVTRDGKLYMVLGAPGGGRIITGVFQVLVNVVDFGMNIQEAVSRPRFHHQWKPDKLFLEEGFSPDTIALLRSRGHRIDSTGSVARVEAILIEDGWLQGATDRRGHGKAAGY